MADETEERLRSTLRELREGLDQTDPMPAIDLFAAEHPADQAELFRFFDGDERRVLLQNLGDRLEPEFLSHTDEELRPEITRALGAERTALALAELESDDAIAFLEDLDDAVQLEVLAALPAAERSEVQRSLAYPEYTAGRLMQRAFVALPDYWVVGQAIDYLRQHEDLPDDFYDIFLVNPRFEPVGSIPLSMILRSGRSVPLRQLRSKELRAFPATADQEQVARAFRKYGLVSAPVVGERKRLIGVLTVDDIVEVIDEEAEDDLLKLGGLSESDLFRPLHRTVLQRQPWLLVNLGAAVLAALVIAQFGASIEELVALAVLMPIVASMAGNAGAQTMTVAVRGIATGEITADNALRFLKKEILVGLANGASFLIFGTAMVLVWFGYPHLALVFGGALLAALAVAAVIGVAVPLILDRLKADPAIASAVFVTTLTDMFSFFTFLGVATLVLL